MKTSEYIYGEAANNMHGSLENAIEAGVISQKEAKNYSIATSYIMSGRSMPSNVKFEELTQFKLDMFFKRDEIDKADLLQLCREKSGEKYPVVAIDKHGFYDEKGNLISVNFVSRFN